MAPSMYLVRRGADAEDEPGGEVGPGDRARGRRRLAGDHERGQEEENNSGAERLAHHIQVQRAGGPQRVYYIYSILSSPAGRARGGCAFIYLIERGAPWAGWAGRLAHQEIPPPRERTAWRGRRR